MRGHVQTPLHTRPGATGDLVSWNRCPGSEGGCACSPWVGFQEHD